jgi:hypothetical protein
MPKTTIPTWITKIKSSTSDSAYQYGTIITKSLIVKKKRRRINNSKLANKSK